MAIPTNAANLPEIVKLLMEQPDSQRLVRSLLEAAAWIASPDADRFPTERAQIAAELGSLVQLEREIRTLRNATETRWDGRSSAFIQADALARESRDQWFASLTRLADALDVVRRGAGGVEGVRP